MYAVYKKFLGRSESAQKLLKGAVNMICFETVMSQGMVA